MAKHAVYELRTIMEDVAFEIWELAILPMLLFSSETWTDISKKTLRRLSDFFNQFFRIIFRIGSGCPIVNFYWQTGSLKVQYHILQKKMMFYHHLANLPVNSLGRTVLEIQVEKSLPGLAKDIEEHLTNIGVNDIREVTKYHWKKKVKSYVAELNKRELLEDSKKYKKISYDEIKQETFERKKYFRSLDLEAARLRFRISSKMVEGIRSHFPRKYKSKGKNLLCPSCTNNSKIIIENSNDVVANAPRDDLTHIMTECVVYEEMRANKDIMSSDSDLVAFFREVTEHRLQNNEE